MTTYPDHVPLLQTDRLLLRALGERDIPAWYMRATDRDSAYFAGDPIPKCISEGQLWLKRSRELAVTGKRLLWGIDILDGSDCIGTVGLRLNKPEISFVIGRPFWSRGYATEAAREVLNFGFETLQLTEVRAEIVANNFGSKQVLKKLGFKQVGRFIDDSDGVECEEFLLPAKRDISTDE